MRRSRVQIPPPAPQGPVIIARGVLAFVGGSGRSHAACSAFLCPSPPGAPIVVGLTLSIRGGAHVVPAVVGARRSDRGAEGARLDLVARLRRRGGCRRRSSEGGCRGSHRRCGCECGGRSSSRRGSGRRGCRGRRGGGCLLCCARSVGCRGCVVSCCRCRCSSCRRCRGGFCCRWGRRCRRLRGGRSVQGVGGFLGLGVAACEPYDHQHGYQATRRGLGPGWPCPPLLRSRLGATSDGLEYRHLHPPSSFGGARPHWDGPLKKPYRTTSQRGLYCWTQMIGVDPRVGMSSDRTWRSGRQAR